MAAALLVGLGAVLGVLGLLEPDLYVIGLLILIIGGVGVLVRAADWIRCCETKRPVGVGRPVGSRVSRSSRR